MLWLPTLNDEVLMVAAPADRAADPSCVSPSKKVTVPLGIPACDGTTAVMVTAFDRKAGLGDGLAEITGVAGTTVRFTVAVSAVKAVLSAGVKNAVSVCCPTGSTVPMAGVYTIV